MKDGLESLGVSRFWWWCQAVQVAKPTLARGERGIESQAMIRELRECAHQDTLFVVVV